MSNEHIKMPDVPPLARYVADGIQTQYLFPFPVFATEDLLVRLGGALQYGGFTVSGAGQTEGGAVDFSVPPPDGVIVILERRVPLERMTDFLEGGDFSARALNNELDFLIAAIQQVGRDQAPMLRYSDDEMPAHVTLPPKGLRAGKVLGFDGSGNPVVMATDGVMAAPDFTASGMGAVTRSSSEKLGEFVSIGDFGAIGDGLTDDTAAFQQALAAHSHVFVPEGVYLVTQPVTLGHGQSLFGAGMGAVIKAQGNGFDTLAVRGGNARIESLRIEGGAAGISLAGGTEECVQNLISHIAVIGADVGIRLDGGDNPSKPCYWNNIRDVLIEQPLVHGVHLIRSGVGDTPNANRFHRVRVFSKGAATSGSGFYIEEGAFNNAFVDCEANVNGATAAACFRVGAGSNKTLIVNLLCESTNIVPNVRLDAGSVETSIINLSAESDGAAIYDLSGGNYDAVNAGYPDKNRLRKTTVTDLKATLMRYDTRYSDDPGTLELDLTHSVHIIDAVNGAVTVELPKASDAPGVQITVKKKDDTANIVTITEADGGAGGPDGNPMQLGGRGDYATLLSNGAQWFVMASNRVAGNTRYIDSSGTVDIDMAVDTYLLSSFGGAMTARLPPADAAQAIGRTIIIKKTDSSANVITVTEQGGNGPDQHSQPLSSQYSAITVVSDGGQWFIVSKHL